MSMKKEATTMEQEEAIEYLQRKGKIRQDETTHPKWTKKELEEIEDVVARGKVYGDPHAEIQW